MSLLEVTNVSMSFSDNLVLDDISFKVEDKEIFGFLGSNGAGKTTTIKIILGLLEANSGTVKIDGKQVVFGDSVTNKDIGFLQDIPEFYDYMNAKQFLKFCGECSGMTKEEIKKRSSDVLSLVDIEDTTKKIKHFSRGQKQRLGIAQALLSKPKLLIFDEPTSSLDPIGRKEILEIIKNCNTTVIFSTHILSDVERICTSFAILDDGKVQSFDNADYLVGGESSELVLVLNDFPPMFLEWIKNAEYVRSYHKSETELRINMVNATENSRYILMMILELELTIIKFSVEGKSLENFFMEVVK